MMKKFLFLIFMPIFIFASEVKHIVDYEEIYRDDIKFFEKYNQFTFPFNHYLFTKSTAYIRKSPSKKSEIIKKIRSHKNIQVISLVENENAKWYKVKIGENIGYVNSKNALKREFKFNEAIEEAEIINQFLQENLENLRVVNSYRTLLNNSKNDIFGNSSDQSILAHSSDKKKHFNIQDRTILAIDSEQKTVYNVKVQNYPDLILSKKYKNKLRKFELDDKGVQKFIFIDRKSQNLFAFEKNENEYTILLTALVTTGKNSKYGFETPYGNFLVAMTKSVMSYTSDVEEDKIIGDALYATRFSAGAYIHGIPSVYEPKETRNKRKLVTQSRLGTYPLSHKCVRSRDEVAKFIYKWASVNSKIINPVIVIVR